MGFRLRNVEPVAWGFWNPRFDLSCDAESDGIERDACRRSRDRLESGFDNVFLPLPTKCVLDEFSLEWGELFFRVVVDD